MNATQGAIGKKQRHATGVVIILIVAALVGLVSARLVKTPATRGANYYDIAPDFSLVDTDGTPRTLDSFLVQGEPVLIEFVHPNASTCLGIGQYMSGLRRDYGANITIVSIAVAVIPGDQLLGQPTIAMTRLMKQQLDSSWTYLVETSGTKVRDAYAVSGVPLFYLLDANGRVVYIKAGAGNMPSLTAAVIQELRR